MQRTLKREFKELEIVERETAGVSYSIVPGSEPSRAGALFPEGEPASVFLPTRPPSRGARWRGRPKPRGIKIGPLLAGGATPARTSTPPGRPRTSSARPPPGGRRHPDPPRGSGGPASGAERGGGGEGEKGFSPGFAARGGPPIPPDPVPPSAPVSRPVSTRPGPGHPPEPRARDAGASKGPRPTPLGTRTKESNARASVVVGKPRRAAKATLSSLAGSAFGGAPPRGSPFCARHRRPTGIPPPLPPPGERGGGVNGSSRSALVRTRKVVNYARARRSQRKLWWKLAAILTCKSFVGRGYRGERPIELEQQLRPGRKR